MLHSKGRCESVETVFPLTTERPRIAIIGGGIAGCVFAAELAQDPSLRIDLYEAGARLGGLHNSPVVGGLAYDIGAFFFEPTHQLFKTFPGLAEKFVSFPSRAVSVGDGGKLDRYPISLNGYIRNQGMAHFLAAMLDLGFGKIRYRRRHTLPSFMKYYLGSKIYERSGLRHYIERLFGLPDAEVDLRFAEQRMGVLREWTSLRHAAGRFFRSPTRFANQPYFSPTVLARPREGFSAAYAVIEAQLRSAGVEVYKGAGISSIANSSGRFQVQLSDQVREYDLIVSTAPLPVTAKLAGIPVRHRFETVSLLTLFYRFQGSSSFDGAVLHNFSHGGAWKRIIDFSYIYGDPQGYFAVEIPVRGTPDIIAQQEQFELHLAELGLFRNGLHLEGSELTRNAYPIFRARQLGELAADKQRILDWGIILAGRQGEFEYLSSSQVATVAALKAGEVRERFRRAAAG